MRKKGSWFAAIKKVFVCHSKDKPTDESEEEEEDKKSKEHGKPRHGQRKSLIPLFREPSSIEKILADAEREHNVVFRPPATSPHLLEQAAKTMSSVPPLSPPARPPDPSPRLASPRSASPREPSPRVASPGAPSRRVVSPRAPSQRGANLQGEISYWPETSMKNCHASATKIQAAYRGYVARRSFKALRGLVRLQGVVRGQNVKRRTMNAVKHMQLFVRVQSQIQSRRFQMLEDRARQQAQHKEAEGNMDAGNHEDWDVSSLTKEEVHARLQRKVDAVIKRERAMSYAYSHQLRKLTTKSPQTLSMNIHSGGYRRWWNWIDRQLPQSNAPEAQKQTTKNYRFTPPRSTSQMKLSPRPQSSSSNRQPRFGFSNIDSPATPRSARSSVVVPSSKLTRTPPPTQMVPPCDPSMSNNRYSRVRASGTESPFSLKDDDSLLSCPPFSVPNYMSPTISAKAKARASSNPRDRYPGTPTGESSRSVNSAMSLPAGAIRRKPFNRFV